jgi:hypothetical protein
LAITARPVAPDPVKKRWSNGRDENAGPRPPPSAKKASLSSGRYFGEIPASNSARALEFYDHRPIPGSKSAGERPEAQEDRIVPRHDHADDAQGLRDQAIARAGIEERIDAPPPRSHPARKAFLRVAETVEGAEDLAECGLERAAPAIIGVDRGDDAVLVVLDEAGERLEVRESLGVAGLRRVQEGPALRVKA